MDLNFLVNIDNKQLTFRASFFGIMQDTENMSKDASLKSRFTATIML